MMYLIEDILGLGWLLLAKMQEIINKNKNRNKIKVQLED